MEQQLATVYGVVAVLTSAGVVGVISVRHFVRSRLGTRRLRRHNGDELIAEIDSFLRRQRTTAHDKDSGSS